MLLPAHEIVVKDDRDILCIREVSNEITISKEAIQTKLATGEIQRQPEEEEKETE